MKSPWKGKSKVFGRQSFDGRRFMLPYSCKPIRAVTAGLDVVRNNVML